MTNTLRMLRPGYAWNPLIKFPRNAKCPCDSGLKFKYCHLVNMPAAIPEKLAQEYKDAMRSVEALAQLKFVEDPPEVKASEEDQKPKP